MAIRFARTGSGSISDHLDLINKGERTHEELDWLYNEVEDARGGFPSLNDRLLDIISRIGSGGGSGGTSADFSPYIYYVYESKTTGDSNIRLESGFFRKGSGELEVFRGGLRQSIYDDYNEVDDKEVVFFEPLNVGEIVVLRVRDRFGLNSNLGFHSEYFITSSEQRNFTINYHFDRDGKWLEIYLNGILQSVGIDYVIVSTNRVLFKENIPVGSLVYFRVSDKSINEEPILVQEKFIADGEKISYDLSKFNYNPGNEELEVYVMGVRVTPNVDYIEVSPNNFEFYDPPFEGSIILACKENLGYPRAKHLHCYSVIPIGSVDGVNKEFLLSHIPIQGSLLLYVGGIRQGMDSYKVIGNRLVVNYPIPKGTDIFVDYAI